MSNVSLDELSAKEKLEQIAKTASIGDVISPNDDRWVSIEAFKDGDFSLGQLAKALGMNKHQTLELLGDLKIPFADYDLNEDLETLDVMFDQSTGDS